MDFRDIIKNRRLQVGKTLEEVAEIVGVSKATVQRWESGVIKNLRGDKIAKLAEALDTTPAYLMGWSEATERLKKVNMDISDIAYELDIPKEAIERAMAENDANSVESIKKIVRVAQQLYYKGAKPPVFYNPLIPVLRCIHDGTNFDSQEVIGQEPLPPRYTKDEKYFWLIVEGDSMEPKIAAGDYVLVRVQRSIDSGDIAIVALDDQKPEIKKVCYGDDWIELLSFNPYYPPRRFNGEETLRLQVIGKVIESKHTW